MLRGALRVRAATPRSRSRSIRARSTPTRSPSSAELGFNRISVGIQDFDPAVQKAVNRIQTEAETLHGDRRGARQRLRLGQRRPDLRAAAADGGRILGDARQGDRGVARPHRALQLRARAAPVQAAAAHRRSTRLPAPETKLAILALAIEKLGAAGYVYIGMDHFAKPTDELAVAQAQRKLHRNFQGYSTKPDCDLLAFGISAIGKVGAAYVAEREDARRVLRAARRQRAAGDARRRAQRRRPAAPRRDPEADVQFRARLRRASARSTASAFADYFAPDLAALAPLAADGLVELDRARHPGDAARAPARAHRRDAVRPLPARGAGRRRSTRA